MTPRWLLFFVMLQVPAKTETSDVEPFDVAVLGAGFGGIGAALELARRGRRVVLLEKMTYPGGCAGTFLHRKRSYEAGATLTAGLGAGQLFGRWISEYDLPVRVEPLDPVIRFRGPAGDLDIPADRDAFIRRLIERPGADEAALRRFFALQGQAAQTLWPLLDDADLLPPFGWRSAARHVARTPGYLRLLPRMGKSLGDVLARVGLAEDRGLRLLLDAVCQITLQGVADEIEAPFALATLDFFFRGTGHVRGGLGTLAEGLLTALQREGGDYRPATGVRAIRRTDEGFVVAARGGEVRARRIISNLMPLATASLLEEPPVPATRKATRLDGAVREGWGAVMLYLDVDPTVPGAEGPAHFELVDRDDLPPIEGNHVFCSLGGEGDRPAEDPWRPVTVSTHLAMKGFVDAPEEERQRKVEEVQQRMRETMQRRAPELVRATRREMTASPRTFQRFTGRADGFVGGVPRRPGWHNYRIQTAPELVPGLRLVGDSTFPGQSILATALGGVKAARLLDATL